MDGWYDLDQLETPVDREEWLELDSRDIQAECEAVEYDLDEVLEESYYDDETDWTLFRDVRKLACE